jgi:hypothetical protein
LSALSCLDAAEQGIDTRFLGRILQSVEHFLLSFAEKLVQQAHDASSFGLLCFYDISFFFAVKRRFPSKGRICLMERLPPDGRTEGERGRHRIGPERTKHLKCTKCSCISFADVVQW